MRKVDLRMNEQEKYEVIKNLVENKCNKNRASEKLSCSRRTINRLIKKYNAFGKESFIHGNRDRPPIITKDQSLVNDIITLYNGKYQTANFSHFKDLLEENENIIVSYAFIYNTLTIANIHSPKIQRKTRKKLKKIELQKNNPGISKEELLEMCNNIIALEDAHPRKERSKYFGELLQMDASNHLWFGQNKSHLHLAIDDATGMITGAYFDKEETLFGYYNILKIILENYGIPYKFLTDNRTVFNYNKDNKSSIERDVLTQFGYACKILGIDIETTSIAQAKGRVERVFETLQSRLVMELKLAGITTIEEANLFLIKTFIPKFNKKFALPLNNIKSVFEKQPTSSKINETLAVLSTRKIDNGHSIKYNNIYYQPYENDKIVCFSAKTECLVIKCFDNSLLVTVDEKVYELRELKTHKLYSENFNEVPKIKEERTKYVPPMTHPWKAKSFQAQMNKAHKYHIYA